MKRCAHVMLTLVIAAGSLGGLAAAQPELPGFVVSDLQLISQESKPAWSERWTGPIQAATILAWLHDHGYPDLLRDLNGDGVIDELDTIELADILGVGLMGTETPRGTTDPRLVVGLAQYVAQRYPDEFVIKIYDQGFPAEFAVDGPGTFASDVIPGIELRLETEPSIEAYEYELQSAEGVIVGLEEDPDENNTYLTGRSFLFDKTSDGYTAIDLCWAEEDAWKPGAQGQVLETVAKMTERFYARYNGAWTPVEFLLALSPITELGLGEGGHDCPEDAVAYDVTTSSTSNGDVEIEECVTREGDVDTYTYTLTNVSFQTADGCGICLFVVPNALGLPTIAQSGPPSWPFSSISSAWAWWAPLGSCGILPGQSAVFSVSVPGPTVDTQVLAGVGECPPAHLIASALVPVVIHVVDTTGPGEELIDIVVVEEPPVDGEGCPDLIVEIIDDSCTERWEPGWDWSLKEVTVTAKVTNIGNEPTAQSVVVSLSSSTHSWSETTMVPALDSGGAKTVNFSYAFVWGADTVYYSVEVDPYDHIDECREDNNEEDDSVTCPL
jgi:hypothetical protein